jgi:tripartite-type tricarboxylate transporter receptor subunit TctC
MADDVATFYADKQMQFVIRSEAGSGYDQYARLLGRHIVNHIPGKPRIIAVNMPGGGGLTAANFVAVRAPKDGTVLTIVGQGLPSDQALGLSKGLQADMNSFNWIGNLSSSNQLTITWHASPVKTIEDARQKEAIIGTAGAGSISTQIPLVLNALAGTKFKMISGYSGTGDLALAMERREIDGYAAITLASIRATRPAFLAKNQINIITQMGVRKDKDLPDVPLMSDLAKNSDDRAVIEYLSKGVAVGRPIATTPGVPPERVAALRKAFDATLSDPAFMKDADTQHLEINPMTGEELAQIVRDLLSAPAPLLDRVRSVLKAN